MDKALYALNGCFIVPATNVSSLLNHLRFVALGKAEKSLRRAYAPDISPADISEGKHCDLDDLATTCPLCKQLREYRTACMEVFFHVLFGIEYARLRMFSSYNEQYLNRCGVEIRDFLEDKFNDEDTLIFSSVDVAVFGECTSPDTRFARRLLESIARTANALGITLHYPFDENFDRPNVRGPVPHLRWPAQKSKPILHLRDELYDAERRDAERYL